MAEDYEVHVDHGMVIPPWMKWAGGIAATSIVTMVTALGWGLVGGGIDRYVEEKAAAVVQRAEAGPDGIPQAAKINELTHAVGNLTTAIQTSEDRNREFRQDVRNRLDSLTNAVVELSQ